MNYLKAQLSFMSISERISLLIFVILVLGFLGNTSMRIIRAYQFEGEYSLFDSQDSLVGDNDPDGFRLEYPTSWSPLSWSNGHPKENLRERRVKFKNPYYFFSTKTYVTIWWRRVDNNWTMYDAKDWYSEEYGFGISQRSLDSFQETSIGIDNYPALENTVQGREVVLFVVGDEAFALEFQAKNHVEYKKMENIFERMLNSFEVYQ